MPKEASERAVNVIHLESKGKEKVEELEVMLVERKKIKKVCVSEEVIGPSHAWRPKKKAHQRRRERREQEPKGKSPLKTFHLVQRRNPMIL